MQTRIFILPFLVALLLFPSLASAQAPVPQYHESVGESVYAKYIASEAQCPSSSTRNGTVAEQTKAMNCLLDYARAKKGIKTAKENKKLVRAARLKNDAIIRCQDFNHDACGKDFGSTFKSVGYSGRSGTSWSVGENIAWGTGDLGGPQAIMVAWLESAGHRKNIFTSQWRDYGIALRVGPLEGNSNVAVWTNTFGYVK